MAGIYIHIPFCRKACHYCDFHFSTSTRHMAAMAEALARELQLRKDELGSSVIDTLYLGGGTPSLMPMPMLDLIRASLTRHYSLRDGLECTVEANPDDLLPEKLKQLRNWGANRLSIGIQTFDEAMLQWMNRSHNAVQAVQCVRDARAAGFERISIDLIYGLPGMGHDAWLQALQQALALEVEHISAYCLTVEEKTVLGHRVRTGKENPVDEEAAASQFATMQQALTAAGYEQYEVSNFARPGHYSRHNSAYWKGEPYLGIGPSAHSLTEGRRSWNVANNAAYLKGIQSGSLPRTVENPQPYDRYNEWVMTGLRTAWGLDMDEAQERFDVGFKGRFAQRIQALEAQGKARVEDGRLKLTAEGLFLADGIAADFFILDA